MNGSAVRKTDIRIKKTYDKLYAAFFELLAEKPFSSISILDICEKANIHRATFYKHFVDKQDFISFCCNRLLDTLNLTNDVNLLDESDESKTMYINICRKVINFVYENKSFIADITSSPGAHIFAESFLNSFTDMFEKRLNKVVQNGGTILSPIPMLSTFYAGGIVSLLKWWVLDGEKYTKDDILRFAVARFSEAENTFIQNKNKNSWQASA